MQEEDNKDSSKDNNNNSNLTNNKPSHLLNNIQGSNSNKSINKQGSNNHKHKKWEPPKPKEGISNSSKWLVKVIP